MIGAGDLGRTFAIRCAAAGFDVFLEDVMPSRLHSARQELALFQPSALSRVRLVSTVEDAVREADVAIDFLPDELESKLEIFSLVDRMAPPKTILCTPTGVLSINDLASCTYRPAQCVALNGWNTALPSAPLQVIRGRATSSATLSGVVSWLEALGHMPQVVEDDREPLLFGKH